MTAVDATQSRRALGNVSSIKDLSPKARGPKRHFALKHHMDLALNELAPNPNGPGNIKRVRIIARKICEEAQAGQPWACALLAKSYMPQAQLDDAVAAGGLTVVIQNFSGQSAPEQRMVTLDASEFSEDEG